MPFLLLPGFHGLVGRVGPAHYIISVMRSDRAKYAINNFAQGTAEENKATAQSRSGGAEA
jgi:hypothetical protein